MGETYTVFDTADYIETEEDARQHLILCAAEDPGDGSVIRAALASVARARNMSQLARDTGLTRAGLYKALREDGSPSFATVAAIVHVLGLKILIAEDTPSAVDTTPLSRNA